MKKFVKFNFPVMSPGSFKVFRQVCSLLLLGGGIWYLFTSGEAIKNANGNNIRLGNTGITLKDTVGSKIHASKNTIIFTPFEKYEAQTADSFYNALMECSRFNGSVLVAHDGKILYTQQFGYADFKSKKLLTDTSEFQLGSVSKQFTAVCIMMLKERGLLNFDDSIVKYFPDFPYRGVTIRMLLDHRSGLPNYMFTCSAECADQTALIDNMQVMNMLAEYKPHCYFSPNRRFNYCNTNYCVLAAIVEKITGQDFSTFLYKNVFEPLQMTRTFIYDKYDTVVPNKITGYNSNYSRSGIDFLDGVAGDKGIYSTVADLLKWDQALYGNKLVYQATLKEAYTPYTRWRGGRSYGFGWRLMIFGSDTVVYHSGWWHGFNCDFIRDIQDKNTIIVLSNHVNWCIHKNWQLLALFHQTPLANMPETATDEETGGE